MTDWLTPDTVRILAGGVALTLALTVTTSASSMILGIGVGMARLSENTATRRSATAFVEVFRNVPALIQIIFWAFAFPSVFSADVRATIFFDNPVMAWLGGVTGLTIPYYALAACLGLTLNTGAHLAELYRAGVGTIPRHQLDAARVLGAGRLAVFWTILLPGGLRAAFPAVTTRLIHNMKNTALVSFVAVPELFSAAQAAVTRSFRAMQFLTLAAIMYLMLATAMAAILGRIDVRLHRGRPRVGQH